MKGLVIKNTGSWYQVKTDDERVVECKVKGNFRLKGIKSTNPVVVGDYVWITLNQEGTALITEIEERKNYIIRRSSNLSKQSHILAANIDQCMLVITVSYLSKDIQLDLFETAHIRLEVPCRTNQKDFKSWFKPFRKLRKRVETVFSQLDDQFLLLRNYAKDVKGIFTRVLAKMASMTALQYLNKINNRPVGKVKYALC